MKHAFGWLPSAPDFRDHEFSVPHAVALPAVIDLRPMMPPVYDQGQLGSCTANAAAAAFEFDAMKQKETVFTPSRLFIYYMERKDDGDIKQDGGSELRTAAKVLNKNGVADEKEWPYVISKFATKPPAAASTFAAKHKSVNYAAVDNTSLIAMKTALASGFPIMGGFTVYDSFESDHVAKTGIVPMPSKREKVLGGHAILVVGYDDKTDYYIVRNSWGDSWGAAGYFYMPYAYFSNPKLATDFWVINSVK